MQSIESRRAAVFARSDKSVETRSSHALGIWQAINILLLSLVTGVFWGTWLGLSRSMSSLSAEAFLEVGDAMIGNLGTIMAMLMPAALLSTLPVLYLLYRKRPKAFYVTLAGLTFFVLALMITVLIQVPLDMRFQQWTAATLPANWQQLRDRWEFWHVIRSWVSVIGLALMIAGALLWRETVTRRTVSVLP
jgi:uncharacterized membrane protein